MLCEVAPAFNTLKTVTPFVNGPWRAVFFFLCGPHKRTVNYP